MTVRLVETPGPSDHSRRPTRLGLRDTHHEKEGYPALLATSFAYALRASSIAGRLYFRAANRLDDALDNVRGVDSVG